MYAWLYGKLPGPTPLRVVLVLALLAAVVLLLMEVVFPAVGISPGQPGLPTDTSE